MSIQLRDGLLNQSVDHVIEDLIVRFLVNVPNEDLSSIERVFFQVEEAQWFYTDFVRQLNPYLPGMKMKLFASTVLEKCPLIWKWGDPTNALARFGKYKSTIPVRGVALFNKDLTKVVLLKGTESNAWSFPRGKISKDESDIDCAVREAEEETGFNASGLINEQDVVERTIRGKNYKIYLVKNVPEDFNFQPLVRNEISKIEWHDLKTVSKKAKSNPNYYFIVSTVLKPMMRWVNKNKGILNDEEQIYCAEVLLKKYLGIQEPVPPQENNDAGRELLNILQKVTPAEEKTGDSASQHYVQMHVPQHIQNQIPMFYGQQFQHGFQAPGFPQAYGMPFSQPLMAPPVPQASASMPVPSTFPPSFMTPTANQQMFSAAPPQTQASSENHVDPMAQQPNPQNLKKPLVVTNRLLEANPKELLSILNSKRKNLEPSAKHNPEVSNVESNRSKAQILMSVLGKKEKQTTPKEPEVKSPPQALGAVSPRSNGDASKSLLDMLKKPAPKNDASKELLGMLNKSSAPSTPNQDNVSRLSPQYQAPDAFTQPQPSNELEASLIQGNTNAIPQNESGKKVTLLKRQDGTNRKDSLEILNILNKPKANHSEQNVRSQDTSRPKERTYSASSKGLLDLLKGGSNSTSQKDSNQEQHTPLHKEQNVPAQNEQNTTLHTAQVTSPAHELLDILKRGPAQQPTTQAPSSTIATPESFDNFENFDDFVDASGDVHKGSRFHNNFNFDIASDDEEEHMLNSATAQNQANHGNFFANQGTNTNMNGMSPSNQTPATNAHGQNLLGLLNGGNSQKRTGTAQDGYQFIYGI